MIHITVQYRSLNSLGQALYNLELVHFLHDSFCQLYVIHYGLIPYGIIHNVGHRPKSVYRIYSLEVNLMAQNLVFNGC